MDSVTEEELAAAEVAGRRLAETEPRAVAARYDAASGRIDIELANGCLYGFPATLVQDLQGVSADDLSHVKIDGAGFNLHWPALDVDLRVPELVAGIFGTHDWMARELARHAGRRTSSAKAVAARANGLKGGRPKKTARS